MLELLDAIFLELEMWVLYDVRRLVIAVRTEEENWSCSSIVDVWSRNLPSGMDLPSEDVPF